MKNEIEFEKYKTRVIYHWGKIGLHRVVKGKMTFCDWKELFDFLYNEGISNNVLQ